MAGPYSWRERLLDDLVPGVAPATLAADPDCLLLDEALLAAIRGRGFELLTFADPVAFRLAYELRFRSRRANDPGGRQELLLRFDHDDLAVAPYDLLQDGRQVRFSLSELFPGLSHPVLASLSRSDLDAVQQAQLEHGSQELGQTATKDFVLRHVFDIRPAEIRGPAQLLHVLLRKHCRGPRMSRLLEERFLEALRRGGAFVSWPLESIVPDREAFLAFLQERWPVFLDGGDDDRHSAKTAPGRRLKIDGPARLPLGDPDIRAYLDSLFLEGSLVPVPHTTGVRRRGGWVAVGIHSDPEADRLRRAEQLMGLVGNTIPQPGARHPDWLKFAWRWAELSVLWWTTGAPARRELTESLVRLRGQVDEAFFAWMEGRYAGLHNQPPDPPAMVHHVPRYLARRLEEAPERKVALIVVDGLALDQWLVLRGAIAPSGPPIHFRSDAVFAWAPTITSVSRQAIFSGRPPFYFKNSIHTTKKEASLWRGFWAKHDLAEHEVAYLKHRGDGPPNDVRERISSPGLRVLGLVVHKVDEIMHGMRLGASGMHNQIRQWAEEGYLAALLEALIKAGFVVFLTSDHGNIEATGYGRPSEGALVSTRGKRARVYPDTALRNRVLEQFPNAIAWPGPGLPAGWNALLAPGRSAFAPAGDRVVGHGGASLEEVVVPLIEIRRQTE